MITIYISVEYKDQDIPIRFPSKGGNITQLLQAMKEVNINFPKKFLLIIKKDDEEIKKDENQLLYFDDKEIIILKDISYLENLTLDYFNIDDINNLINIKPIFDDKNIPLWRIVFPGINLWGECTNKNCDAYNQIVAYFVESNELNLIENNKMKCPICNTEFNCSNICFFNCYYNYYGKKRNQNTKNVEKFGKRIENFDSINIPNNNIIIIDSEEYTIKKTDIGECDYYFDFSNSNTTFSEMIFQVRKFK